MPESLPAEWRQALHTNARRRGRFGDPVFFYAETGSTNDVAAELAERGAPEGAMVVALAQTGGRGRLGRTWFSPAGSGIYVSLVCRNGRVAPVITLVAGVAVAEGVRSATGLPVIIKWPNDVVVPDRAAPGRRRKLAGVLAEASTAAGSVQHVVVGIGINLRAAAFPPDIASRATSIEMELGRPVEAGDVLAEILSAFNAHFTSVATGNTRMLLNRWCELAPSCSGSRIQWSASGTTHTGMTAGIGDDGALLVRTDDGVQRILSGEVTWL